MRIAHLSDLHLLEPAQGRGLGVRFVSLGRPLDPGERFRKTLRAIDVARRAGAEHFVFSGDLTETGTAAQFEALAAALAEARLAPDEVTLVPGNHDAYDAPDGWRRALDGPLRAYAPGAALEPAKVVERRGVMVLPVDGTFYQPVTRSAGRMTRELAAAIEQRLRDPALRAAPVVVAIHHPPHRRPGPWHWVDGLLGCDALLSAIARRPNVTLMHGHLHRAVDRGHGLARVVGAGAVVDGARVAVHDVVSNRSLDLVA